MDTSILRSLRTTTTFPSIFASGLLAVFGLQSCATDTPQVAAAPLHDHGTAEESTGGNWLANHQDEDGRWDADGFSKHCPPDDPCTGPGGATHDVGVTGMALLAFLGAGQTPSHGPNKDTVARGIHWLRSQQNPETGLIGKPVGFDFVYDHSIATLALTEAYFLSENPLLRDNAQQAINYILRARNPYGAWRYDSPPVGDNDTAVTGWAVMALVSAKSAGLEVDEEAFVGALNWLDSVSDPATGRAGYDSMGSLSSRTPVNQEYPREKGEAMSAVALFCRCLMGQTPETNAMMTKHAELLQHKLPEWDPEGLGCDMYYWYYGTAAMYQMGGEYWKSWNAALKQAVLASQVRGGHGHGSWDPVGPWGYAGGRVYSTSLMALCQEVYYRYAVVLGAR